MIIVIGDAANDDDDDATWLQVISDHEELKSEDNPPVTIQTMFLFSQAAYVHNHHIVQYVLSICFFFFFA